MVRPPENEIPSGRPAYPQWYSLWNAAADCERRHLGGAWEGGGQMARQALHRFALQRLGQDTQDSQDTQDCACLLLRTWNRYFALGTDPMGQWLSAQAYLATVLGVLGVLGVLVRPPENEISSGQPTHPQWHSQWNFASYWERRHLGGAWECTTGHWPEMPPPGRRLSQSIADARERVPPDTIADAINCVPPVRSQQVATLPMWARLTDDIGRGVAMWGKFLVEYSACIARKDLGGRQCR